MNDVAESTDQQPRKLLAVPSTISEPGDLWILGPLLLLVGPPTDDVPDPEAAADDLCATFQTVTGIRPTRRGEPFDFGDRP